MKASIFLATYNKGECLRNTLSSIVRQETSFPFEVCIVDDVSEKDPLPHIEEILQGKVDFTYKRLGKHVGGQFSQSICTEIMSPDSTVAVIQSCDVMYLQEDVLEELCLAIKPGFFSMATVKNIPVDPKMHSCYTEVDADTLGWDQVQGIDIYSGKDRPSRDWLFFLGGMTREDLFKIDFDYRCCDVVVQQRMKEQGMRPIFLDHVKAVHQLHPPAHMWPCSIVDRCEYWCSRKRV